MEIKFDPYENERDFSDFMNDHGLKGIYWKDIASKTHWSIRRLNYTRKVAHTKC